MFRAQFSLTSIRDKSTLHFCKLYPRNLKLNSGHLWKHFTWVALYHREIPQQRLYSFRMTIFYKTVLSHRASNFHKKWNKNVSFCGKLFFFFFNSNELWRLTLLRKKRYSLEDYAPYPERCSIPFGAGVGCGGRKGRRGRKQENFLQSTCLTQTYFWLKVTEKQLDKGTEILPSQALFLPCFLRFDECPYYL